MQLLKLGTSKKNYEKKNLSQINFLDVLNVKKFIFRTL